MMAIFRNFVTSFSSRQSASEAQHFLQILNESLSYKKYSFVCLLACLGTTMLRVFTQREVVISYRHFGPTYRSHLHG